MALSDSAGKTLVGYIKAAGTGETLDAEFITAWFNGASPYNPFITAGKNITSAINTADANKFASSTPSLTNKALFYLNFDVTVNSGQTPSISSGVSLGSPDFQRYFTGGGNGFTVYNTLKTNFALTPSAKKVLTPAATGATIVSSPGGATYSWTSQEAGFNYNDTSGYTYVISGADDGDMYDRIGGRLYKIEAPEGAVYPYVVFYVVTNIPEYPGGNTIERFKIQFSIFSSESGTTEVENILTDLWTLYDDIVMTITGYAPIHFIRGVLYEGKEDHTTPAGTITVWHYIQEYDGWIVKS